MKTGSVSSLLQGMDVRTYVLTVDSTANVATVKGFEFGAMEPASVEVTLRKEQSLGELFDALKIAHVQIFDIRPQENRLGRLFLDTIRA